MIPFEVPRLRLATLSLMLSLLGACQVAPPPAAKKTVTVPTASAHPATGPSASPTSRIVETLLTSPGASVVKGVVRVDAGYAVAGGAGIVANDGATIVANDGATLIGQDGTSVVAGGAGNAIAAGGAVIAGGAGNIVAAGGGNVVAGGGGHVVAGGAGNYRALLAVDAQAPVPFGTQLPAAGMLVWVKDLVTGFPVPIGIDKQGEKVWAAYTNAKGEYTLFLPTGHSPTVLVVAEAPHHVQDGRLGYAVASGAGTGEAAIAEESSLQTLYMRTIFRNKFAQLLTIRYRFGHEPAFRETMLSRMENRPDPAPTDDDAIDRLLLSGSFIDSSLDAGLRCILIDRFASILRAIRANPAIQVSDYPELSLALGDVMLGATEDLEATQILPIHYTDEQRKEATSGGVLREAYGGLAEARITEVMRHVNERVIAAAQGDSAAAIEGFFKAKPYLAYANTRWAVLHPGEPEHYRVLKPADLMAFFVEEYFSLVDGIDYGCTDDCPGEDYTASLRLDPSRPTDTGNPIDAHKLWGLDPAPPPGTGGLTRIRNWDISALERAVGEDLGFAPQEIVVLNAAGTALAQALAPKLLDDAVHDAHMKLINRYNRPESTSLPLTETPAPCAD